MDMLTLDSIQAVITPVDQYADAFTLKLPAQWEEGVLQLAETTGFADDQLRYVLALLLTYPLGLIFANLPNPTMKHLMSFGCGLAMFMVVLGNTWVHSMFTSLVTYAIVRYGPAHMAPYIVSLFLMAYLSCGHLYRVYVDYMGWTLDFTGPQMILTIKLMSFAFNYYDGVVDRQKLKSKPDNKVFASRLTVAISEMPSMLEYLGYCYNFSTLFAGPAFEMREYLDSVSGVKFYQDGKKHVIPSRLIAGLSRLIVGALCIGLFVVFSGSYNIPMVYTPEVLGLPFVQRAAFMWFTLLIVRMKYYFAWKVAEGACVFAGFGFEGYDKEGNVKGWSAVSNIDIFGFEFAQSIRDGSRAWNKGTQNWLERYVYTRTNNSLVATYFCSAFWHGFYPGYYMFFLSVPLATTVNRELYRRVRPWFLNADGSFGFAKKIYDLVGRIVTSLTMNYLVLPFQILAWEYSILVMNNMYYCGHLCLIATLILTKFVPRRKLPSGGSSSVHQATKRTKTKKVE